MNASRFALMLLTTTLLAGCQTLLTKPGDSAEHLPVPPQPPVPQAFNNGAIFQPAQSTALFEDYKARRVGDLLTVLLVERTDARKSAATSVAKDSSLNMDVSRIDIFGRPVSTSGTSLLGATAESQNAFDGAGDSTQSNQLDGQITVTVAEVLSNGNLMVQGEKWLGINQGKEFVRLRGIVRQVDIGADNSVRSTQIANAQVSYGGTGTIAESNTMGWLTRFFASPLMPL
ncbi:flagellar basal body L-ring protein FlgH [Thiospirillum jenense]|nr:flagellar basal body L-ring protein FlgH [Thiospirillum jenense]